MRKVAIWTDEETAMLTALWRKGAVSSQIAAELGRSRNQVMGKLHRLGLLGRRRVNKLLYTADHKPEIKRAQKIGSPAAPPAVHYKFPPRPVASLEQHELPSRGECKWPLGDGPPYVFCGAPALQRRPYCSVHAQLAYVNRPDRSGKRYA